MKKRTRRNPPLLSLLVSISIYLGAIGIFFYANGWRINPKDGSFVKTGVLTVQSDPFLANIYIDGEIEGRTPKSVSLPIGKYDISVHKNGYIEWKNEVEIKEEKSTPIYPWLIKKDIIKQNIFLQQDINYINSWVDENSKYFYFLVNTQIPTTTIPTSNTYSYSLYKFDIDTSFWDMSNNPKIVLTFEYNTQPEIDLKLSPNGLLAILSITQNGNTTYYLLDSTNTAVLDTLQVLNIDIFSEYTTIWSKDSQYLMFESNNDLISFDISKGTRYLLIKKNEDKNYIWTTDEQGFFYKIIDNHNYDEYDNVYSYSLVQEQMDGSNSKTLIEDIFFQKNKEYITKYQDDTGSGKYAPFTNSPESTKSVGEIESIIVNQFAKGIYIQTDTSSYWYNMDTQKYHLISPFESSFIRFAPDNYKLIFKDNMGFNVFTFMKEVGDHTVSIGALPIKNLDENTTDINWVSNSSYIWYTKDSHMYISDKEGNNNVEIIKNLENIKHISLNDSREKVITLATTKMETGTFEISIDSFLIR
jgi:hypothetical protein